MGFSRENEISHSIIEITLNDFFEIMLKSWVKESAYPTAQKDPQFNLANDPT